MKVLPYIAQNGVHHKVMGGKGTHNAMWDFAISPEGKIYFSLCSELIESSYARFYEYIPETEECKLLFKVEDVILPAYRTIRHSKIHTSISFLPNGHILMSTHTTDKSPVHPCWLPEGYYAHPWEGFSGSHLIDYDPETGEAHTLGIPVPFESIYGGVYVEKTNRFYFTGYIRGHLYSYDLSDKQVKDYGQVTEYGCFRLHKGTDGKLYWSTRSGYLARLNVDTDEIEQLSARFTPAKGNSFSNKIMRLDYAVNLPDGRMIMAAVLTDGLYIFDPKTEELVNMGSYGEEALPEDPTRVRAAVYGPALDFENVLWYVLESSYEEGSTSGTLVRWDILHDGKPEVLGTMGTPGTRIVAGVSEAYIYHDVYYVADTNHATDLPAVFTIDLKEFRPHRNEHSVMPEDPYTTMGTEQYREMAEMTKDYGRFLDENPFHVRCDHWNAWKLWLHIKPEQSPVMRVVLDEDGDILGLCSGEGKEHFFRIHGDDVCVKTRGEMSESECIALEEKQTPLTGKKIEALAVPGRQYKAIVTAEVSLGDGRSFVGTQDGVVGIVREDGSIYRLGRACINGPVRGLAGDCDGKVVYGVGGDENDLGIVFRYTEKAGLEELGALRLDAEYDPGIHMSSRPCCLDVSRDGKKVVIGARDRMGTVYELNF
ncbi:hypothetical protein ACTNEW_08105 [Blautia sp. HCP3S3_G3]|uniref:hypothetical protein n=1 Tax=Blautia sp. HCP3S3_G3 TaxID=3438913 RepID=UPI003F8B045C